MYKWIDSLCQSFLTWKIPLNHECDKNKCVGGRIIKEMPETKQNHRVLSFKTPRSVLLERSVGCDDRRQPQASGDRREGALDITTLQPTHHGTALLSTDSEEEMDDEARFNAFVVVVLPSRPPNRHGQLDRSRYATASSSNKSPHRRRQERIQTGEFEAPSE